MLEELNAEHDRDRNFGQTPKSPSARAQGTTTGPQSTRNAVLRVDYEDGRPRFTLQNGQVWRSDNKRKLTVKGDGADSALIDKTPVGYLLHFNGSFFGLAVTRVR